MQIFWHGYTCVRIESKTGETECTLLTDPYENEASIRLPRTVEPDVLVLSHQDKKRFNIEGVAGHPFIVADPGEYEVKGMFVNGIQDRNADEGLLRPVIYRFVSEGMSVAFLGSLKRQLSTLELEGLQNIDILLLPVGGGERMDAKTASAVISEIEPRIVVPLYYDIPGIKEKLATVDAFCKQLGSCQRENANRLKIAKKDLPADNILVSVLERV
jgi:L-ascorbate metabolism protein UlaG (beta-lactamase superfamily)